MPLSCHMKWVHSGKTKLTGSSVVDSVLELMPHHVNLDAVYHESREKQVSLVVDRLLVLVGHRCVH